MDDGLVSVESTGDHLAVTSVDSDVTGRDQDVSGLWATNDGTEAEELRWGEISCDDSDGAKSTLNHGGAALNLSNLSVG